MPFTDEDLKRLKDGLDNKISISLSDAQFKALLARLEAAEDVASHVTDCPLVFIERWRKAAGK